MLVLDPTLSEGRDNPLGSVSVAGRLAEAIRFQRRRDLFGCDRRIKRRLDFDQAVEDRDAVFIVSNRRGETIARTAGGITKADKIEMSDRRPHCDVDVDGGVDRLKRQPAADVVAKLGEPFGLRCGGIFLERPVDNLSAP